MTENPTTFISYAWESEDLKNWVKHLATKLRDNGIDAKLDQWEIVPGDQMPHFMEKSVRDNDFVLIICTPKYKTKSEERIGGVGYEGDVLTPQIFGQNFENKLGLIKFGNYDKTKKEIYSRRKTIHFA